MEYFKKSQSEREARDRYLTVTYCKLTSQWTKKVDRVENSRKRKEREGRSREMYEKIFPELRKQREDKERDARLGTRGVVKSDADFEDVIERLQEQEVRLKVTHRLNLQIKVLLISVFQQSKSNPTFSPRWKTRRCTPMQSFPLYFYPRTSGGGSSPTPTA